MPLYSTFKYEHALVTRDFSKKISQKSFAEPYSLLLMIIVNSLALRREHPPCTISLRKFSWGWRRASWLVSVLGLQPVPATGTRGSGARKERGFSFHSTAPRAAVWTTVQLPSARGSWRCLCVGDACPDIPAGLSTPLTVPHHLSLAHLFYITRSTLKDNQFTLLC